MADDSQYADSRAQRNREHHENNENWTPLREAARELVLSVAEKHRGKVSDAAHGAAVNFATDALEEATRQAVRTVIANAVAERLQKREGGQ